MTFRRIDENTINCIITEEDMTSHGIRLDDLFEKKEQAMEFLHSILEEAARQVGYQSKGGFTSMQMSVLGDNSVSLTISERSGEQFDEMLRKLQEKLGIQITEQFRRELAKIGDDESRIRRLTEYAARIKSGENEQDGIREADNAKPEEKNTENGAAVQPRRAEFLFEFSSFRECIQCSERIAAFSGEDMPEGELYRAEEGKEEWYCLILSAAPGMTESVFSKIVLSLNEFAGAMTARAEVIARVREHGRVILKSGAVQALSSLGVLS